MDQIKIGKFIAECRKKNNLTQMQLAEKLNITDRAISKWENGKTELSNQKSQTEQLEQKVDSLQNELKNIYTETTSTQLSNSPTSDTKQ